MQSVDRESIKSPCDFQSIYSSLLSCTTKNPQLRILFPQSFLFLYKSHPPNHTFPLPLLLLTAILTPLYCCPLQISSQNSPKSPFVPCATSSSRWVPYFLRYSTLIFSKCRGSQWKRTRRLTRSSVRSLEVSARAWCRRRASRTGRLSTPLRMCARVSPWGKRVGG